MPTYHEIIVTSLHAILQRPTLGAGWLDTKVDLRTGRDADASDPLRGPRAVYGWVQGRALEALARHDAWLATQPASAETHSFRAATRARLATLLDHAESVRRRRGRLTFLMDREGNPMRVVDGGVRPDDAAPPIVTNLTDLFYAKGLAEAAACLERADTLSVAVSLFDRVVEDVREDRLRSDQQALDPRNPVGDVPGRRSHAPRMLAIAGATRLMQLTGDRRYDDVARAFMAHILDRHVAAPPGGTLQAGDFWEFITPSGEPYNTDGRLWSDPGHAIEAAGFALRHLRVSTARPDSVTDAHRWIEVALQNFANGYSERGIGVCKSFDLRSRRPINPQMPWWSLPESMRTACEALVWAESPDLRVRLAAMFRRASDALLNGYIRPELALMARQCLEPDGSVADAIPAVPDADPGYHTNLCLIDVLDLASHPRVGPALHTVA